MAIEHHDQARGTWEKTKFTLTEDELGYEGQPGNQGDGNSSRP
jgi:hypothetical protein